MKIRGVTIQKVLVIQDDKVKVLIETPIVNAPFEAVEGQLDEHQRFTITGTIDRATLDLISPEAKVGVEFDDGTVCHALIEISSMRDPEDPEFTSKNRLQFQANLLVVEEEVFNHLKFNPAVFA
jgi:hypothetical protein